MNGSTDYFTYLQGRSLTGLIYRKYWLYPWLCRYLRGRVLDVGCGIGDMLRFRPGTIGVDINPATVEWCKAQGLDVRLMPFDALPFSSGEFDSVVLDNVLEHLVDPRALLAEVRRVLRPAGILLLGVPGKKGYACDPDHKRFYSEDDLKNCMKQAGFECNSIFHMPFRSQWFDTHLSQYCLYGVFRLGEL